MAPAPDPTASLPRALGSALIVDDHPLFCDALAMTLSGPLGIGQVDAVGTLGVALERLASQPHPDVIVLDLNLPDVNGMDGVLRIRQAAPEVPIVVVSSLDELRVVRAALQAGVNGFVPKHANREEFSRAFAAIARGEIHAAGIAPDQTGGQVGGQTGSQKAGSGAAGGNGGRPGSEAVVRRLMLLTKQQARILQLISTGLMNKQIAYELSIAETTVKAHVTAIMRKLGVQTRMQAVLFAQEASFAFLVAEG